MLAPGVALALVGDVTPLLPPVADRREDIRRLRRAIGPEVDHNRLAGRHKAKSAVLRQPAVRAAPILGEGEEGRVGLEEVDRLLDPMLQLELQLDRVGLQVDEPAAGAQLRQGLGAAVEVDQQLGGAVEAFELELAHPEAPPVVMQGFERPAIGEAEAAHDRRDELGGERGAVVVLPRHQHRRGSRVRLDVVGLVAQPLEAQQVVKVLPDDAGHRHLGHHAQEDDLRAAL